MAHPEKATLFENQKPMKLGETIERELIDSWDRYRIDEKLKLLTLIFGERKECNLFKQVAGVVIHLGKFGSIEAAKSSIRSPHYLLGWESPPKDHDWLDLPVEGSNCGFCIPHTNAAGLDQVVLEGVHTLPRHIMTWPFYKIWFGSRGDEVFWIAESAPIEYLEPLHAVLGWGGESYIFRIEASTKQEALNQVITIMHQNPETFGDSGFTTEGIQDSVTFHVIPNGMR